MYIYLQYTMTGCFQLSFTVPTVLYAYILIVSVVLTGLSFDLYSIFVVVLWVVCFADSNRVDCARSICGELICFAFLLGTQGIF